MPSNALTVFQNLLADAENLLSAHPSEKGTAGRPAGDTGPLLRSTLVLIHTAWENYVEQSILEASEVMFAQIGDDFSKLPEAIRQSLNDNAKDAWSLAGDQWKNSARAFVEGEISDLNTPNVKNTRSLHRRCLDISGAFDSCGWPNYTAAKVKKALDEFVHDIRGEIVHKGTVPGPLNKGGVESWRDYFVRLVKRMEKSVEEKFTERWSVPPWAP